MSLELPAVEPAHLTNSPLEIVVSQIRYETSLRANDSEVALAFHEAIGGQTGLYPSIDRESGHAIGLSFAPGAAPIAEHAKLPDAWKFSSRDKNWTVSLAQDFVAIETTAYTTWAGDFQDRLFAVIDATAKVIKPALNPRFGLRYVDRITELQLGSPREWARYVSSELVAPATHAHIGPGITQAQHHVTVELGEDLGCNMRYGFLASNGSTDFFMDYDLFRLAGRAFDPQDLKQIADNLNDYALRLFHASVNPELIEILR